MPILFNNLSNQTAISSILFKLSPSEFPWPGRSIVSTLKPSEEIYCSVNDHTTWDWPLPCNKITVSLLVSKVSPASDAKTFFYQLQSVSYTHLTLPTNREV